MKLRKSLFIFLAALAVSLTARYFASDKPESNMELVDRNNFLNDNKPVHLPGCQTYQRPVPKKVIYPTVRKNFVTRLCALEVLPPYGVIILQKADNQIKP